MNTKRLKQMQLEMRTRWQREIGPKLKRNWKLSPPVNVKAPRAPTATEILWVAELLEYAAIVLDGTSWSGTGRQLLVRVVEMRAAAKRIG